MARSGLTDFLQNHKFWLLDVGPLNARSLPVLAPLYGFSAITAPSIQGTVTKIKPGNSYHHVPVITGGEEGEITLRRGASFGDIEFYRWILAAITGDPAARPATSALGIGAPIIYIRRTLFLVQFFPRVPFLADGTAPSTGSSSVSGIGGVTGALLSSLLPTPVEGGLCIPARGWLLKGCVPVKYTAASDFDATDSGISVMELTLQPEKIEEINLGA